MQYFVAPGLEEGAQANDRPVDASTGHLTGAPSALDGAGQSGGPDGTALARRAEFAPAVGQALDVWNLALQADYETEVTKASLAKTLAKIRPWKESAEQTADAH